MQGNPAKASPGTVTHEVTHSSSVTSGEKNGNDEEMMKK
jgi:hypothetical protein